MTVIENGYNLYHQVAVVTGGGGVLCAEMCFALASAGCSVVVLDINIQNAERIANIISQSGGSAISCFCDVLDKESIQESL
jgi:NAD(P)-dependent dehydrogenase (short-subunit alcohol dehydrogenase family)